MLDAADALIQIRHLGALLLVVGALAGAPGREADAQERIALSAQRAEKYLYDICRLGRRVSGTRGMEDQQKLLVEHFQQFECETRFQPFDAVHPLTGAPVRLNNLIVTWHPERKQRILLCCHYDTRPFPDRDRRNPQGLFVGANDGGSGVALFMEMAHSMDKLECPYGIDFVFFDAEELIFGDRGEYFLGSTYFARQYRSQPPAYRYVAGVLVDMIGDKDLSIYMEKNSLKYAPQLTKQLWTIARRMEVDQFIARKKHEVRDDHLPLNEIAQIPTCDIIDFDYPHWHTTRDVPENCSGESLVTVGKVVMTWLSSLRAPGGN